MINLVQKSYSNKIWLKLRTIRPGFKVMKWVLNHRENNLTGLKVRELHLIVNCLVPDAKK
jgi:hypothetical protein